MKLIVCLDDSNGLLFNNRRQSRDSVILEDIFNDIGDEKLNIFPFSESLFAPYSGMVNIVCEIGTNGVYFIENIDLSHYVGITDEIIVYRWNRVYPSDFICDIDFSEFEIKLQTELKGKSHETITKIIYGR